MKQPAKIKTNIKFRKGLDGMAERIYGFVTKVNGSWRGCREEDDKKKIVFVDEAIVKDIVPDVLYSCSLVPMRNDKGFIAKTATVKKFEAIIRTSCRKNSFIVSVKFGNKQYIYDPASKNKQKCNIKKIADLLRSRIDLIDAHNVAEEFINQACMVKRMYEQSLDDVH